jgi:autotransporter-associated beta strand protein
VSGITLGTNNAQNWNSSFTFVGTDSLNLGTGAVTLGVTPTVTVSANTLTVGGPIGGGSFGLTKAGSGTLSLTGTSTYTGTTTISAGTLSFKVGNTSATGAQSLGENATLALGLAGTSPGTLQYSGTGTATVAKNISVVGSGANTIQNSGTGTLTLSGTLTKADTHLVLNGGSSGILVTGTITSTGAVNAFDSDLYVMTGTTTLASANTYAGATHIYDGGTLVNGITNALPVGTVLAFGNTDTITSSESGTNTNTYNLNGHNQTVVGLTSGNPTSGTDTDQVVGVAAQTSTLTLTPEAIAGSTYTTGTYTYSGSIGGGGSGQNNVALTVNGTGTQILTGTNTYTGPTTITAGTLQVGASGGTTGTLSGTSGVTISTGGTLLFASTTSNAINSTATVSLGGTIAMARKTGSAGTAGITETMGALTLTSGATIDFGAYSGNTVDNNTLIFASLTNTTANLVTANVDDWIGAPNLTTDSTDNDQLLFTQSGVGNTSSTGYANLVAEAGDISFYSGNGSGYIGTGSVISYSFGGTAYYEIVPVPEPSTIFGSLCLLGLLGWSRRRQIQEMGRILKPVMALSVSHGGYRGEKRDQATTSLLEANRYHANLSVLHFKRFLEAFSAPIAADSPNGMQPRATFRVLHVKPPLAVMESPHTTEAPPSAQFSRKLLSSQVDPGLIAGIL